MRHLKKTSLYLRTPILLPVALGISCLFASCRPRQFNETDAKKKHETSADTTSSKVSRPPQFVLLAFDGSYSNAMWKETRDFADSLNAQGKPVHFTYFVSCVYYLWRTKKNGHVTDKGTSTVYAPPSQGAGASAIGFGDNPDDILARLEQTALAQKDGHEIASHACGHFDGSTWKKDDWAYEMQKFSDVMYNAAKINDISVPKDKKKLIDSLHREDLIGMRAPLLGVSTPLWDVLRKQDYRYDTSRTGPTNYWPEKIGSLWNFPLAQLKIVGSGKRTLSMDYNFFVAQSKGSEEKDPEKLATYKKEMIDTYMAYFHSNYYGNRAPVSIGHHFSKWNSAIYWKAMKTVAENVCGMPEVKCVAYRELAEYLENRKPTELAALQKGSFETKSRPLSLAENNEKAVLQLDEDEALDPRRDYSAAELRARGYVGDEPSAHEDVQTEFRE